MGNATITLMSNGKPDIRVYQDLLRQRLSYLSARHNVDSLSLFGSRVRGDQRHDSDLDVLVSFRDTPTLFQLIALEDELSDLLGIRVDLVLSDSLKPPVAERVAADLLPV